MLDGKTYRAIFPDDPIIEPPIRKESPLRSAELLAALAALERDVRSILKAVTAE
jgi:hypothetical protein